MSAWELPRSVEIGSEKYQVNTDFRDILEIIGHLNDRNNPEFIRWQIAVSLFFEDMPPRKKMQEAMQAMSDFISQGEENDGRIRPKLIDWEQDAQAIIADVNKVAGQEIRALPYLHWWTFLSFFRGIGEGQLSTIVSIRSKLAKHQKLEKWEKEWYMDNKSAVDFKKKYTAEELSEKERLNKLLG